MGSGSTHPWHRRGRVHLCRDDNYIALETKLQRFGSLMVIPIAIVPYVGAEFEISDLNLPKNSYVIYLRNS